jgi:hypothetical protein
LRQIARLRDIARLRCIDRRCGIDAAAATASTRSAVS